jgi:hypothetical protein
MALIILFANNLELKSNTQLDSTKDEYYKHKILDTTKFSLADKIATF